MTQIRYIHRDSKVGNLPKSMLQFEFHLSSRIYWIGAIGEGKQALRLFGYK